MQQPITVLDYIEARDAHRAETAARRRRQKMSETAWQVAVAIFPALLLAAAMVVGAVAK